MLVERTDELLAQGAVTDIEHALELAQRGAVDDDVDHQLQQGVSGQIKPVMLMVSTSATQGR